MAISETALRNPPAAGIAALEMVTSLFETLIEADVISRADAWRVCDQASERIGLGGPSLYKEARTIITEVAEEFGPIV